MFSRATIEAAELKFFQFWLGKISLLGKNTCKSVLTLQQNCADFMPTFVLMPAWRITLSLLSIVMGPILYNLWRICRARQNSIYSVSVVLRLKWFTFSCHPIDLIDEKSILGVHPSCVDAHNCLGPTLMRWWNIENMCSLTFSLFL